jgi:branched-chain amino acid transport system ATP-binding protein
VLDHGVKIADDVPEVIVSHPAVIEAYIGKEEGGEVSSGAAR